MKANLKFHVIADMELAQGRPLHQIAEQAIAGGATLIQLRDKISSSRNLYHTALELRRVTRKAGIVFIVNDRLDIAQAVEADGVHLGQEDLPGDMARRILGPDKIIGISADNLPQAQEAHRAGADYLGTGPVFATSTKPDAGAALGIKRFSQLCAQFPLPAVGIGSINAENAADVIHAGAAGVAVISAVIGAENVKQAAAQIARALEA